MIVTEIQEKLKPGDLNRIAEIVGCSSSSVGMILRGERNHKTNLGQNVIYVAGSIIQQREDLKSKIQTNV